MTPPACHSTTNTTTNTHTTHNRRRKSPYTPRYNPAAQKPKAQKSGSYWDAVDWDAPLRFAVPDRWYVWVAWAVVAAGVAAYVWHTTSGGGAGGGV